MEALEEMQRKDKERKCRKIKSNISKKYFALNSKIYLKEITKRRYCSS